MFEMQKFNPGDLVKVTFARSGEEAYGFFVSYDENVSNFRRANIMWFEDGQTYSCPCKQVEVISESR